MIHREEARLQSLFRRLLVLSVAAAPAACSSAENAGATDASLAPDTTQVPSSDAGAVPPGASEDAGLDATLAPDASGLDASTPAVDALDMYGFLDAACDPQYVPLDAGDDGGEGGVCDFFEYLPCGLPVGTPSEKCALLVSQCGYLCSHIPTQNRTCAVAECLAVDASSVPTSGPVTLDCATGAFGCGPGVGRRPRGLAVSAPARAVDAVGATLAEMAHLEAASVHAFRRLASELAALRAPRALVRQAERAARDEVRHARTTAGLARKRGAKPAPVVIERGAKKPSLLDFAIENGVEGCVRESFGALVATRQASRARDPEIAQAMKTIAKDETRHAALSWAIARWVAPRLRAEERARVDAAMERAIASLRVEAAATPEDVARELGLPTRGEAEALVDGFAAACFRAAA
jgi:hypothetical protein